MNNKPTTTPDEWASLSDIDKWIKFRNMENWLNLVEYTLEEMSGHKVDNINDIVEIKGDTAKGLMSGRNS